MEGQVEHPVLRPPWSQASAPRRRSHQRLQAYTSLSLSLSPSLSLLTGCVILDLVTPFLVPDLSDVRCLFSIGIGGKGVGMGAWG